MRDTLLNNLNEKLEFDNFFTPEQFELKHLWLKIVEYLKMIRSMIVMHSIIYGKDVPFYNRLYNVEYIVRTKT
jgi:hypothetical protein